MGGPSRYTSLGRATFATSTGPRLSLSPYTTGSDFPSVRQAQVSRKAFRFVKRASCITMTTVGLHPRHQGYNSSGSSGKRQAPQSRRLFLTSVTLETGLFVRMNE